MGGLAFNDYQNVSTLKISGDGFRRLNSSTSYSRKFEKLLLRFIQNVEH